MVKVAQDAGGNHSKVPDTSQNAARATIEAPSIVPVTVDRLCVGGPGMDADRCDDTCPSAVADTSGEDTTAPGDTDADGDQIAKGDDVIRAGAGDDAIDADFGNNTIHARDGAQKIHIGIGNDTVDGHNGGTDLDTLSIARADDAITVDAGAGGVAITSGGGDDTITGGTGTDALDRAGGNGLPLGPAGAFSGTVGDGAGAITDFNTVKRGALSDGDETNIDFIDLSGHHDDIWELHADRADRRVLNRLNDGIDGVDHSDGIRFATGDSLIFTLAGADGTPLQVQKAWVACNVRGSRIRMPAGEAPVERLRVGGRVVSADSGPRGDPLGRPAPGGAPPRSATDPHRRDRSGAGPPGPRAPALAAASPARPFGHRRADDRGARGAGAGDEAHRHAWHPP